MAKNIVFCADGTWNGPGSDANKDGVPDATNVLKLFTALAGQTSSPSLRLQDEQEKEAFGSDGSPAQVAKYLHGVGDSRNPIKKLLGGVFGEGFVERIVRGYTFVSRTYEAGDRIYLVGFSRGAYTVRALGGMIVKMGLLGNDAMCVPGSQGRTYDAERAYRSGIGVWAQYRRAAGKKSTLLGFLEEFHAEQVDMASQVQGVGIRAVGVWDTVGALGIPIFSPDEKKRVDVFAFADTALSPQVSIGLHAVSIDEERGDFEPTLWSPREGVEQVWFAGAHADVGGGYPEAGLSNHALDWMERRLGAAGLLFSPDQKVSIDSSHLPGNQPWTKAPFDVLPHRPRVHPPTALFHRSVERRLRELDTYQPKSLGAFIQDGSLPPGVLVD